MLSRAFKYIAFPAAGFIASQSLVYNDGDGVDCHIPACSDKIANLKDSFSMIASEKKMNRSITEIHDIAEVEEGKDQEEEGLMKCPLDRSELGRSSWDLIHTMAANYPETPTQEQQEYALNFVQALAHLYPCKVCAKDFQMKVKKSPPKVHTREEFVIWWCERHNDVNKRLGKRCFECEIKHLDKRWRINNGKCK